MYKIVVEELEKAGKQTQDRRNSGAVWSGRALAAENCRISALSSADYCLRDRVEVAWGRITWRGNRQEICRLFEAERLDSSSLESLDSRKDYTVLFLGCA